MNKKVDCYLLQCDTEQELTRAKAADDMYEALKSVGDLLFGLPENKLIKKALAKAEGMSHDNT